MKHLFWIAFSMSIFVAHAQDAPTSIREATSALSAGNCAEALQFFQQLPDRGVEAYNGKAGQALVLSSSGCAQFDADQAYRFLLEVHQWYDAQDSKQRARARDEGYQHRLFKQAKDSLLANSLATASVQNIRTRLEQYSPILARADQLYWGLHINRLEAEALRQQGNSEAFKNYLEANTPRLLKEHPGILDTLHLYQMEALVNEVGWSKVVAAAADYPSNGYLNSPALKRFVDVRQAGTRNDYTKFVDEGVPLRWQAVANDSIKAIDSRTATETQRLRDAIGHLRDSTAATQWPEADQRLGTGLAQGRISRNGLEEFLKTVPNERVPQTLDRLLDVYVQAGTLAELAAFLDKYPGYDNEAKLQIIRRRLNAQARRGTELPLETLVERIANDARPEFWPSADWAIYNMVGKESLRVDSFLEQVRQLPPERLPQTLGILYQNAESEGNTAALLKKLPRLSGSFIATLGENYSPDCKRRYRELIRTIKPLLLQQKWQEAAIKARAVEYSTPLNMWQPYSQLLDMLTREEEAAAMIPFGGEVNTSQNEFLPVLSPDETTLYYCREKDALSPELLCAAVLQDSGWLDKGQMREFAIGSRNTAPLALSTDGKRMLIFRDGQVYESEYRSGRWQETELLSSAINAGNWQGMGTYSPDGQILIFEARDRVQSVGGTDLFIAFMNGAGEWQNVQALSRVINTEGEDRSPFLHPDTRTLYFSSDGHGGLGDMDVYKTTRLDDTWLHWSQPEHLGRYANTVGIDWCYKINTSGQFAYFSADPDANGSADIFSIQLSKAARPNSVTVLDTRLLDAQGKPLQGTIQIEDAYTGEIMVVTQADGPDGHVNVVLPSGRDYIVYADDGKRLPSETLLSLPESEESTRSAEAIKLLSVEEAISSGEAFALPNLFFAYNDAALLPESRNQLLRALLLIERSGQARIAITGHTDSDGEAAFNLDLSQRRAESVRQALIDLGVPPARLSATGKGEDDPIADNSTEQGKARNRRVELRLVE